MEILFQKVGTSILPPKLDHIIARLEARFQKVGTSILPPKPAIEVRRWKD